MVKLIKTTTPNKFIEIELVYVKGGSSEYERRVNPRSYRLYIDVVTKKQIDGYVMTESCPADGMRLILSEPLRASKKAEAEAEALAEKIYHGYAQQIAAKNGLTLID